MTKWTVNMAPKPHNPSQEWLYNVEIEAPTCASSFDVAIIAQEKHPLWWCAQIKQVTLNTSGIYVKGNTND